MGSTRIAASDRSVVETSTVTIAVATFRRNHQLAELIPELLLQVGDVARELPQVAAEVLIVDNDPDGGAASVVEAQRCPALRYAHEPAPGLSAVRNRAIDECADRRLLAFMDDDGRPKPGWLRHLVALQMRTGAAAVAGRVLEEYERPPEPWIIAGRFFRRRSLTTGTEVQAAPAGNLLIDLDVLRRLGLRFDPRFGTTGGEDTMLTRQLTAAGGRIVWCEEAAVVDQVPADRMDRRWVLRRAWSHGNTGALVELALAPGTVTRARTLVAGALRVVAGSLRWCLGELVRSPTHQARGLRAAARGAGMVAGSVGSVYEEYRR